jgi:hypothetical protein
MVADAVSDSADNDLHLPLKLSPRARDEGWTGLVLGPREAIPAAKLNPYLQNNSSPQGELVYAQAGTNQYPRIPFAVYPVDLCDGAEGITTYATKVPGAPHLTGSTIDAIHAIENDMIGNTSPLVTAQCFRQH